VLSLDVSAAPEKVHRELPIHRLRQGESCVYYTPGRVVVCNMTEGRNLEFAFKGRPAGDWASRTAAELGAAAAATVARWQRLANAEYAPEALTVHLTGACNLACGYCYSRGVAADSAVLDISALRAASQTVAQSCAKKGTRFSVGFHGGGEPTLHLARLAQAVEATRAEAERAGVEWFGYLATNGTFDSSQAAWLARAFNRISVSCDGPPHIQDVQRPFHGSVPSSAVVERNTQLLLEAGADVSVRATVTRHSIVYQPETVAYANKLLGVNRVSLEPVYLNSREPFGLDRGDADEFVFGFLAAQETGGHCGCAVTTSCARLDEIHGPYCDVLRHTVLLASDGAVSLLSG
jgi:uncharacterized protein